MPPFTHTFQTQYHPDHLAQGDINNDGREDIAITSIYSNTVQVFLGNTTSIFSAPLTSTLPASNTKLIKLADINKDGNLDLLAVYNSSGNLTIKYGNGTGAFTTATTIVTPGSSNIQEFTVADYNNDSNPDIYVLQSSQATGYLGSGAGTFTNVGSTSYGETADFNSDGFLDFIIPVSQGVLGIIPGNGSGYFFNPMVTTTYSTIYSSFKLHAVDFNNDGKTDLISNSNGGNAVEFLTGTGTGSFTAVSTLTFTSQVNIFPVDLNNDFKIDVLLRHNTGNNISYQLFMNINGTSFSDRGYYGGLWPLFDDAGYTFTDINGDNTKEIIICNQSINAFHVRYTGSNGYPKLPTVLSENDININTPTQVRVADINNDNLNDILSQDGVYISIFKNNGQGFDPVTTLTVNSSQYFALYDINNDGAKDIVFTQTNDSVARMLNNGNGTFGLKAVYKTGNNTKKFVCGDFNNDGNPDLVVTNANDNNIRMLAGNGAGSFTATIISAVGGNFPNDVDAGDFNNDGNLDLVIGKQGGPLTTVIGNGSGSFISAVNYSVVGIAALGAMVSDFNNDGNKDLVSLASSGDINIYKGNGAGAFTITSTYTTSPTVGAITVKDFNMDGNMDIIGTTGSGLCLLMGSGAGTFTPAYYTFGSINIGGLNPEVADVSGDMMPDIVNGSINISLNGGTYINSPSSQTLCIGGSITLQAFSANTFTWSPGGSNSSSIIVNSPGNYYVSTSNPYNTCTSSSSTISVISGTNTIPNLTLTTSTSSLCSGQTATLNAAGASTYTWNTGSTLANIAVTPANTATYTATGTSSNGCSAQAAIAVTVNPLPVITSSASSSVICAGSSATLTSAGANTYTWSSGGTTSTETVTPTSSSVFTVSGTSIAGCTSFTTLAITVNTLPIVSAGTSASLICSGQSATLTATGAITYSWTGGGTNPSIVITPTVTTNYNVAGTNAAGCTASATVTQSVSACTGIDMANTSPALLIHPNPFSSEITISSTDLQNKIILVYNSLGEIIHKTEVQDPVTSLSIDLSEKPRGIYFVKVNSSLFKVIKD